MFYYVIGNQLTFIVHFCPFKENIWMFAIVKEMKRRDIIVHDGRTLMWRLITAGVHGEKRRRLPAKENQVNSTFLKRVKKNKKKTEKAYPNKFVLYITCKLIVTCFYNLISFLSLKIFQNKKISLPHRMWYCYGTCPLICVWITKSFKVI